MENDELVKNRKTLVQFEQSTPSLAHEVESCEVELTNSSSMGARISKSQDNGSGVLEEEYGNVMDDVGGGGRGGGGDDMSGLEEWSTRKVSGEGEGSGADGFEVGKKIEDDKFGEKMDGVSIGDSGSVDSKRKGTRGSKVKGDEKSSSIARRTRNRGRMEDVKDVEVDQKGGETDEEVDEEHGFCVGDFVWGKVKSHPWWPGRIYDPSNASEFALKYKHEGRILVAYFGDRTFAWCDPSQLKSFEENFEEMLKQSSLKTFVNAVEEAENEYGRLVKVQMSCSCVRGSQSSLPLVVNAGIKEGVHVPENGIALFSIAHFESSKMLADIRRLATCDSVPDKLELTVLKSQLSAFYHAKFGYSLPIYCEPVSIEGPMDDQGLPREAPSRGPDDGDWLISPEEQTLGQNGLLTPHDMSQKRRKSKTIAELLGRDTEDELMGKNMDRTEGETESGKSEVKLRKKRPKVSHEDPSSMHETNVVQDDGYPKDEEQLGKLVSKSGRKKRKIVDESQNHVSDNLKRTRSSTRKKKGSGRSKSNTSEKKISGDTDGGEVKVRQKTDVLPQVRKDNISVNINGGPTVDERYERISPRERKLSKYLSPPYTNLLQRQRSSCSQTGSEAGGLVFSDVAKMGERMTNVAGTLVGSPPIVKCSAETFQKSSKVLGSNHEKTDQVDHTTSKPDLSSEINGPMKSIGSLNRVLREIRTAALGPLYLRSDQSFDSIKGFVSSYRSSIYKNGPNYKLFKKSKRKKNVSGTKHGSDGKVLNEVDHQQTPKLRRSGTKREQKPESKAEHEVLNGKGLNEVDHQQTPKLRSCKRSAAKREQKPESKAEHEISRGLSSSGTLLITFPSGVPLPTKEDMIQMCRKFGDLNESKTEVVPESSTTKIVFVHSSHAEAAMNSMQKSAPFGAANVTYRIEQLATVSKGKQVNLQNKKKLKSSETRGAKSSDKNPSASPETEPLAVVFIKQKLQSMTSMLAQTDGKMSQEIKSNLESEVKELLKKVKMMTASSS